MDTRGSNPEPSGLEPLLDYPLEGEVSSADPKQQRGSQLRNSLCLTLFDHVREAVGEREEGEVEGA